ncbi:filamentous hemagglutinin family N-terminal domain-containing protein [Pseudomonas asturiensis]|uniref:Filamentous hemagglutinin family N-terminal domain-containing protein n=1 Tax=Pseudomonas asturiensis TaxID=1190415 RepID=A0A1M7Q9Q7_9PSED|nr:hemagglutinin repeat-containing protein [Pseudomonas asturiensis]SHN27059.1 filamentous hemagglutinin family N-terminal domain-containing protein [Pseudomonas asturiensis]
MDVRHLEFLARQPSAAVAPRTRFLGMPKRLLALLLANVMFWQPIWAQADGIAVSGGTPTSVGQAGNGVPVINIAAPNGAGLSHNQFKDYNVGSEGVILNNATNAVQGTQLGGNILGNSQLGGRAASTILNEVNGGNPSKLNGYTEVAGQGARVIIANPYGVSCSGCGFINTPRVTLSTGKPVLDASGKLDHFEVDGGAITIDGQGLDASTVDQFDIITRSAKINADIYARQLNVITGANDVNDDSLATTARAGNAADKPQLAIDSSALGGMYANSIKLVGTEQGVGVRTAGNMAASGGDIQIDANGHLNMAQASAQGALNVTAPSVEMTGRTYAGSANVRTPGELVNQKSLAVRERVDVSAGKVTNNGVIASGIESDNSLNDRGDVSITSPVLSNTGNIEASRSLNVTADRNLTNQGVVQGANVTLGSARITNQGLNARIVGEQSLALSTPAIVNLDGVIRFGTGQAVTLQLQSLSNRNGLIQASNGSLDLSVDDLDNSDGQIAANDLTVKADTLINRSGLLSASTGDARVVARRLLDNSSGTVQAQNLLTLTAGDVINQSGRLLAVKGDLDLKARSLDNRKGSVLGAGVNVATAGGQIDNRGGKMVGDRIDLSAAGLNNGDQGLIAAGARGLSLTFDQVATQAQLLNRKGQIQSDGSLLLTGAWLDNSAGTVLGQTITVETPRLINDEKGALVGNGGDVTLKVSNVLSNLTGLIDAGGSLVTVSGASQVNNQGGTVRGNRLSLQSTTLRNGQKGQLIAGSGGLTFTGSALDNNGGTLLTTGGLTRLELGKGTISNVGGTIQGDSVDVTAGSLNTSSDGTQAGMVASLKDDLKLTVDSLTSNAGKLFAKTALLFNGATLSNTGGGQISGNTVDITASNLINRGGLIESNTSLALKGDTLDNSASGQLRALNTATADSTAASTPAAAAAANNSTFDFASSVNNSNGSIEIGNQAFTLKSKALDNRSGTIEHANSGVMTLDFDRVTGAAGSITTLGDGDWHFGTVNGLGRVQLNRALTYTSDSLSLLAGDRLASGTGLTLNLKNLDNGGELLSDGDLTLNLTGDMTNSGRLSAQKLLTLNANNVSQNGGRIGAGTDARLNLSGALYNLGYLTARQTLQINAAQIDNRGTLGAQGNVNLNAGNGITNGADSLLFSGGTMALRSGYFSNLYGDVYSRGDLSVANVDGSPAQRFSNLSGTVESEGNILLSASAVENAKAEFELGQKVISGRLDWQCGQHCGGHDSFKRGLINIDQTLLETASKDSAPARLVAGKDLTIQAGNVQNRYSLMAANQNLSITANDLLNQGASERTGQNNIQIGTPGRIDTGYWDQMEFVDVPAFNAAVAAGNFDLARFELLKARSADSRFAELSNSTTWTDNPQPKYAATLQAGGTVNLNVARTVQNGSLRANNTPEILTGTLGEDQTGAKLGGIDITINKQATDATAASLAAVQPVQRVAADGSVQTVFTPVDYSGFPFATIDPTAGATFQLPKGDYGLFIRNPDPSSRYLIETNPNLTDLSQFLGSDYVLDKLGISADSNWRRLGDGLYEQRLIRDSVLAQTGRRFLADGLTSDYDQYRYLMDNALASKDALHLSLGVSLSGEQVSALTHDIVWMENRVIDGQKVLVPVLYLAQADSRNVRGNSLIQGRDLNLIAGGDLVNVGTLRASNNLNVRSEGSIYQGGLVDAGNNLQMLAQDSIRNAMAGEIRGGQVSVQAVKGDILNDRTAIQVRDGAGTRTITDTGSTITARENLVVNAGRDITNFGTLRAGGDTTLKAGNDINLLAKVDRSEKHQLSDGGHKSSITTDVKSLASNVTAGGNETVEAGRDVKVLASTASAARDLNIQAARDLYVTSATDVHNVDGKEKDGKKRITTSNGQTTQLASVLTAGNDFASLTGRDTTLVASKITAGNEAYLYAGKDLSLEAAENSNTSYYSETKKGSWGKKSSRMTESDSAQAVASVVQAQGKSTVVAVNDINLTGSTVKSENGELAVLAGNDVNLGAARNTDFSQSAKSKSGGLGLSSTSKTSSDSATTTSLTGSTLSGNTSLVQAGHDVVVSGSNIVSTDATNVQARNDIRIESAAETFNAEHRQSTKKSGLMGTGGIGVTLGSSKNTYQQSTESTTQKVSTVGSVLGDVNVTAGKDLNVIASDIVSGKNIRLTGQNVSILDAASNASTRSLQESKKGGVTLALSGVVGEAVNATVQNAQEAKHEEDTRLSALQGVKAGLSGYQAWQGAQSLESGAQAGSFFGIALSLGGQTSSSTQLEEQSVSQGSSITAGNNLSVIATGNGQSAAEDGDVSVRGSKLQAGNDVLLSAARDIDLQSGLNTQKLDGSNKSGGGAVGISFGFGTSGAGLSIFANGNSGSGRENGNGTVWTETSVNAGNQLTMNSGRDTTLEGAQVSGQKIVADIKRNLTLSSQQDTDRYDSRQSNVSGGASFTIGTMTGSGSASVSQSKIKSDFDSVKEQTGLFAGKDGYQIDVGGHTQLNGSVIGSTATADKNRLNTGTLGWTDIRNKAEFSSQSQSVTGGTGGGVGTMFTGNMGSLLLVGSNNKGNDKSTTYSAISNGEVTVRDQARQQQDVNTLSRDVAHANNSLSPIFDKEKEQKRLRQAQLIADIGNQSMDIIRTQGSIEAAKAGQAELKDKHMPGEDPNASYKDRQAYVEALQETKAYKSTMDKYGTGSSLQRGAQAFTAAVQGLATGDFTQAVVGASTPYLAGVIKDNTGDDLEARLMAHAMLGAVLAKSQQNSAAAGAAGASIGELIATRLYPDTPIDQLSEIEKQNVSALSTLAGGLVGGIVGGDAGNAVAGAGAAKNAVENNQLRGAEDLVLNQKRKQFADTCEGVSSAECQALSRDIDNLLEKAGSLLPETAAVEDDFLKTPATTVEPGQLVNCATSGNGVCVVSNTMIQTDLGQEWVLAPASYEQSEIYKAKTATELATASIQLNETSKELFDAGCAGMGPAGIGCQGYLAFGGQNPVTGLEATPAERVMFGAQAVLNSMGLVGVTSGGAGVVVKPSASGVVSGETGVVGTGAASIGGAGKVGPKDLTTNLSEVWTLKPTQRGVDIESHLAKTEYSPQSGWYNVGAERNGYFPLVDFQNGNTLVSLKSVDTAGSTWLGRMQDHIIDLGTNGAKVNGVPANMVLDLRVQPSGSAAAKSLIEFGREYNVKVIVKEFK